MRLHRFYVPSLITTEGEVSLSAAALIHQLKRVFRLHEGDKAIFFDGSGYEHECEIVSMDDETLRVRILETRPVKRFSERRLFLAASLIKKDNFEWVIQKGTELGVSGFIPLLSERSEKKGFNMERARKIMTEACEQSGRADVPELREPVDFENFFIEEKRKIVAFHTGGAPFDVGAPAELGEIVACVGPEGGWTEREVELFKARGAAIVRLNSPILRAETAAVAISTLVLLS